MLANLLTLLLSLSFSSQVVGLECIQCTSDPSAPNSRCIGNENGTIASEVAMDLTLPCDPKYGDEFCYTMITVEPANKTAANTGKRWNRGCCNRSSNSTVCPSNKPDHVNNSPWWEVWRKRCSEDACNVDAPRGSSEGDGGEGGGGFGNCQSLEGCRSV